MGTSVSQQSPKTHNWQVVAKLYTREDISIDRLTQEIWRAAINQEEGNLFKNLSAPIIADCLKIIQVTPSQSDAIRQIRNIVAHSGQTSLATDIAIRAAIQTYQSREDFTTSFTKNLFSEAGNYLVSRDLSGFIGFGKLNNVSDAIELKKDIKRHISETVGDISLPKEPIAEYNVWKNYVNRVVGHFSGGRS